MNAYAPPPPEEAWDNISQQLNDSPAISKFLVYKMKAYEVAPPEDAWNEIKRNIQQTPVRKLPPRLYQWLAAAAIVTGLLLLATNFFSTSSIDQQNIQTANSAILNSDLSEKTSTPPTYKSQPDAAVKPATANESNLQTPASRNTYAAIIHTPADAASRPLRSSNIDKNGIESLSPDLTINVNPRKILNENGELIQDMSVVNPDNEKYISITAPNGQQTKISSKLAIALKYLSTQSGPEGVPFSSSDTENWKRLITEWRSRIMQSAYVPSSFNFMDILEFSELIKE